MIDNLLNHAAELFAVPRREIDAPTFRQKTSPRGTRRVVQARQAVAWALWYRGMTLEAIGAHLGGRDHTTILDGVRRATRRATHDREYALLISALL